MSEYELNARNLFCPMPVIRTQNQVKKLQPGDILKIYATDPGVKNDIPCWCRINGHEVLKINETKFEIIIIIKV